jgi:phospholipid/cholesterol/gamma-HCH transport system substrate-binding protein
MKPSKKLTDNMKFSIEAKVGVIGIVTLLVLIWGINYLKGRNILSDSYTLHTHFQESGGLEISAPVLLKGIKIGYVDRVLLLSHKNPPVQVDLKIDSEYTLGVGSHAELFSADLLGSKAIRILPSGMTSVLEDLDTIESLVAPDLMTNLQGRIYPIFDQFGVLAGSLDTLSRQIGILIAGDALGETLDHLSSITLNLNAALSQGGTLDNSFSNLESFTGTLKQQQDEIADLIVNLNSISAGLDSAGLGRLATELQEVSIQFNKLLGQVNSEEGSAGKFFYSDSLYENLNILITDMDVLVKDLNENPGDYVQVSVFGKSDKKKDK